MPPSQQYKIRSRCMEQRYAGGQYRSTPERSTMLRPKYMQVQHHVQRLKEIPCITCTRQPDTTSGLKNTHV
jgi:hypothetical protein